LPTRKQPIFCADTPPLQSLGNQPSGLIGDLELNGTASLLLQDDSAPPERAA
jgi:hypothetical protein